ncbi:MAG: TIGR02996 domain-containing protein [Archangium sp.]|nr:TIGR02996 domain-containing protein [Archangium sp.]
MKTVEELLKAVRGGKWLEALQLALPLWRTSRDATLHRLIVGVGQQVDQTVKPLTGPKAGIVKKQLAWAKEKAPGVVGRMLEPNPVGNWADRHRLMVALAAWPADPRIGAHALVLAKSFARGHLTVPSYFPPLLDVLMQHADAVVVEAAKDERSNITHAEAKALEKSLAKCVPLDAAVKKQLEDVVKSVEAPAASGDEGTLLEAIYARPEDDGARAVYADALSARGDPRGEFITLQLAPKLTTAQRARMRSLLDKHERIWSGPLVTVLEKRTYERGFLVAGELGYLVSERLHPTAPEWKTVERLKRATPKIGKQFNQLVELETYDSMSGTFPRLTSLGVQDLVQVAKAEFPKLESLEVSDASEKQLKAFLKRPSAQGLTSLTVHTDDIKAVASLPLPANLKRLAVSSGVTLVREAEGWKLELRSGSNGSSAWFANRLAGFEEQPLSAVVFAGSWNRFGPRNLADAVGPKMKALIETAIDQSRGKFMK